MLDICSPEKLTMISLIFSPDLFSSSLIDLEISSEIKPIFIIDPVLMPEVSIDENATTSGFVSSSLTRIELIFDVPKSKIQIICL